MFCLGPSYGHSGEYMLQQSEPNIHGEPREIPGTRYMFFGVYRRS